MYTCNLARQRASQRSSQPPTRSFFLPLERHLSEIRPEYSQTAGVVLLAIFIHLADSQTTEARKTLHFKFQIIYREYL